MEISGRTRLLGLIGHPIEHSLSPTMHNAAFAASDLDYLYVPLDVRPRDLPAAVRGIGALGFKGFNVTMPHKEAIVPLLDELDETALAAGVVNTVVIEEGGLRGLNTDGSGFLEACGEAGVGFFGARVLLLGAGGAAAAIAFAVLGEGARELRIANRTPGRARRLRDRLRAAFPGARIETYPLADLSEAAREANVVVNATYLGMKESDTVPVPSEYLEAAAAVCDAVYRPGGTAFVKLARGRGLRVVAGDRMLLYQGVQAQRLWTGREPDVGVMSDAIH
jgi:shikimate dehydrogenase